AGVQTCALPIFGVGMSAALASVVLERLFDVLLVIGCFLAVTVIYAGMPADMRRGAYVLATLAGVGFVVLIVMQRHRARAEHLIGRVLARLPKRVGRRLVPLSESFMSGLGGLADLPTILLVL